MLGQALNYALTRWDKLIRHIENGHITPDNNTVENDIRPFAVGRRNWLFAGHPNGANAAATLYNLIAAARAGGLGPLIPTGTSVFFFQGSPTQKSSKITEH
ncbi:MAG: transposase [Syntrophobacter sp.]